MSMQTWTHAVGEQQWAGLRGGQGRPLLALHGWLDNAGSFGRLAPLIGQREWWAVDLPGHGYSFHRPQGAWYHFIDNVSDLLGLVNSLGWEEFDLVGHSMGGGIATLLAAAAPDRVRTLTLIEALGPLARNNEQEIVNDLRRGMLDRSRATEKQTRVHLDMDSMRRARSNAMGGLSEQATEDLLVRGLKEVDGGYTWRTDPRLTLTTPMRSAEAQIQTLLRSISCPKLIVLAEPAAVYLDGEVAKERLQALQPATVLRLPGTHHLHLEDAATVAPAIARLLDSAA